jgi:hypothetical protein
VPDRLILTLDILPAQSMPVSTRVYFLAFSLAGPETALTARSISILAQTVAIIST